MEFRTKEILSFLALWILTSFLTIAILNVVGIIDFNVFKPEPEPEITYKVVNPPEKCLTQDVEEVVVDEEDIEVIDGILLETPPEEYVIHLTDAEYLAMMMDAEAGNQDEVGMRLVADVILNRVDSKYFPDTIEAVIFAPGQFAKPSSGYTDRQLELAIEEMERRIDSEIIGFRTGTYHKNEKWEDAYVHGAHYFSKLKAEYRD